MAYVGLYQVVTESSMIMTGGSKRSAVSRRSNKSTPVLELDGMSTKTLYSHHSSFSIVGIAPVASQRGLCSNPRFCELYKQTTLPTGECCVCAHPRLAQHFCVGAHGTRSLKAPTPLRWRQRYHSSYAHFSGRGQVVNRPSLPIRPPYSHQQALSFPT